MNPAQTVSIHPYFRVHEGKLEAFKALLPQFVALTSTEEACLFYDFTINGDVVFCREAYAGGAGAVAHLENVGALLEQALGMSDLARIEVHGSEEELAHLREPLGGLNPEWFVFECGVGK